MAKHSASKTTQNQVIHVGIIAKLDRTLDHLFAALVEWKTRRAIKRNFAHLSNFHLQDIGLIEGDVEASCSAPLNQPVQEALKRLAEGRASIW